MRRTTRRSLRHAWRTTWSLSGHIVFALAMGLACGTAVVRYPDIIALAPPHAAILGTLVVYPVLIATWWHFSRSGGRGR
jgi:hypothetical protein